jgi:hypothetical protein
VTLLCIMHTVRREEICSSDSHDEFRYSFSLPTLGKQHAAERCGGQPHVVDQ